MTEQGSRALQSTEGLRQALDQVAAALASPNLKALLESEAAIERALADLPTLTDLPRAERAKVRVELERARGALLRCRRLGAALTEFVRVTLDVQGGERTYTGRSLNTRA
jgi:hypothetical protein